MKIMWSRLAVVVFCTPALVACVANDTIRRVHELELEGKGEERASALAELRLSMPDSPEIHWLSGDIRVGDQWVPYAKVADHGDRWSELHKYREVRAKRSNSLDDQLYLADGALDHGLKDEERAHLYGVLAKDPMHAEARQRLGHVWMAGVWLTPAELARAAATEEDTQQAFDRWERDVTRMKGNLSHHSSKRRQAALAFFEGLSDPAAILVMERAFALGTEPEQLSYLTWVCRLNSWQASAAVARLAMASDSATVRLNAIKQLKTRRPEEFAPVLLSVMQAPVVIEAEMVKYGHWWLYSQRTVTETATKKYVTQYNARFAPQSCILHPYQELRVPLDVVLNQPRTGERIMANFERENQQAAVEHNSRNSAWNERANYILSESLDLTGLSSPTDWWAWWTHEQGNIEGEKEQIFAQYQEDWYISRRRGKLRRETEVTAERLEGHASCFVAGTPIMTEFGLKPIESIELADKVLTQDSETGELTFKPVLRTTHTSGAATQKVTFGNDTVTCTTAHPFWVNGLGWRLARELEPGMRFHSMDGAVEVTATASSSNLDVYNLEVADFNTYFVGNSQVLTHDVTVRQPTDMLLPGLAKAVIAAQ